MRTLPYCEIVNNIEYRVVPGFSRYMVGSDGSIWGCSPIGTKPWIVPEYIFAFGKTWRKKSPKWSRPPGRLSYFIVRVKSDEDVFVWKFVHVLILEAFVGPRPEGHESCHNNGNTADCRVSNLRWDTYAGNLADKIKHGRVPRGETSGMSKLTDEAVRQIREKRKQGVTQIVLAKEFGVSKAAIKYATRIGWRHVTQ